MSGYLHGYMSVGELKGTRLCWPDEKVDAFADSYGMSVFDWNDLVKITSDPELTWPDWLWIAIKYLQWAEQYRLLEEFAGALCDGSYSISDPYRPYGVVEIADGESKSNTVFEEQCERLCQMVDLV